jgi:hypothetical protein
MVGHGRDALPVGLTELARLASRMPVVIGLQGRAPEPVIPLAALEHRAGALVDEAGYWQPAILPAVLRTGPFSAVSSTRGEIVMVDEAMLSPLHEEDRGLVPLFEDGAALAAVTKQRISDVAAWKAARAAARTAAEALHAAGCLADHTLGGLAVRVVDETRLAAVAGPALETLHRTGALRLAHLSVVSLGTLVSETEARKRPARAPASSETLSFLAATREAMG